MEKFRMLHSLLNTANQKAPTTSTKFSAVNSKKTATFRQLQRNRKFQNIICGREATGPG